MNAASLNVGTMMSTGGVSSVVSTTPGRGQRSQNT
jgi:hypothetical protein